MTRRGVLGFIAGLASTGLLTACMQRSASFRYRMTVEGRHSGMAVYELLAEKVIGLRLADETPGGSIIRGEALALETPTGPVFLLLQAPKGQDDLKSGVLGALAPEVSRKETPYSWAAASQLARLGDGHAKGDLARDRWPLMVRFRDLADPRTVELVDPGAAGVTRIALETTLDRVTLGIEKRLAWLSDGGRSLDALGGVTFSDHPPLAKTIYQRAFSSEIER